MSRILTSLHGRLVGLDSSSRLVCPGGFRAGENGSQSDFSSPGTVAFFDDFLGGGQAFSTTIIDGWRSRKGSDGGCVDWTVTPAVGGTCVGTIGATTASMAVSGIQLDRGLCWKANQGAVAFQARLQLSAITNIAVFVGFTDQTAALEMPIQSAASVDTLTTNATDAVGFMFDTSMSTDVWWLTGVANDVDATAQQCAVGSGSAIAPVAATYETFRITLSTAGAATFYRNGQQVGSLMAGAVTPTVALTPCIAAFNRTTTGTPTVTVDYANFSATRA
jgi:hypothetical protein